METWGITCEFVDIEIFGLHNFLSMCHKFTSVKVCDSLENLEKKRKTIRLCVLVAFAGLCSSWPSGVDEDPGACQGMGYKQPPEYVVMRDSGRLSKIDKYKYDSLISITQMTLSVRLETTCLCYVTRMKSRTGKLLHSYNPDPKILAYPRQKSALLDESFLFKYF